MDTPGVSVPTARLLRLARAAAAAVVCVVAATGAHLASGGAADAGVLAVVLGLAAGVAYALAGRRIDAGQMVGLLVLAQAVVHLGGGPMEAPGVTMAAAHLLATAVSAVVLTRGERACWRLTELLGLRWLRVLARGVAALPVPRTVVVRQRRRPVLARPRTPRALRGPPVAVS